MSFFSRMCNPADSSIEVHQVAGLGTMVAHWGAAAFNAFHGAPIDLQAFGSGAALIIAAISAAGWMTGRQRAIDPACQSQKDAT